MSWNTAIQTDLFEKQVDASRVYDGYIIWFIPINWVHNSDPM